MLQEWHAKARRGQKTRASAERDFKQMPPKSRLEARRAGLRMPALKVPPSKTGTPMLETVILAGIAVL
jgi:hypothetical protein